MHSPTKGRESRPEETDGKTETEKETEFEAVCEARMKLEEEETSRRYNANNGGLSLKK